MSLVFQTFSRRTLPIFKTGALNHSATLPACEIRYLAKKPPVKFAPLATELVPFFRSSYSDRAGIVLADVLARLLGGLKGGIDLCRGIGLHIRHQMRVNIHRDSDAGVAKPLLHDLGVNVFREHVRGVAMPHTVHAN